MAALSALPLYTELNEGGGELAQPGSATSILNSDRHRTLLASGPPGTSPHPPRRPLHCPQKGPVPRPAKIRQNFIPKFCILCAWWTELDLVWELYPLLLLLPSPLPRLNDRDGGGEKLGKNWEYDYVKWCNISQAGNWIAVVKRGEFKIFSCNRHYEEK